MTNSADPGCQLIWICLICKGRAYPGSAGQGLNVQTEQVDIVCIFHMFKNFFFLICIAHLKGLDSPSREINLGIEIFTTLFVGATLKGKNLLSEQILSLQSSPNF